MSNPNPTQKRRSRLWMAVGLLSLVCAAILGALLVKNPKKSGIPEKPEDQYQLAIELYSGAKGIQDVAHAVTLFELAADAGHPGAQLKLGVMNELGIGFPQDIQRAAEWYLKAAKEGHPAAQTRLGLLLTENHRFQDTSGAIELDEEEIALPDYERACEWLNAAARQDYPPAEQLLGDLLRMSYYRNGNGQIVWLTNRFGGALEWLAKATEAGSSEAALKAAYAASATGNGNDTAYWFFVAKQLGFSEAVEPYSRNANLLGPADMEKGRSFAQKIIQAQARPAWSEWQELIHFQNPGPQFLTSSHSTNKFAALRATAEAGSPIAQFNLALSLQHEAASLLGRVPTRNWGGEPLQPALPHDSGRIVEAVQWYQLAARKGHPDAQFHLATILRYGVAGYEEFTEAQNWFESAARAGHREAMYQLAVMLDEGFVGEAHPDQASEWFGKAAAAGHVLAKAALAEREKLLAAGGAMASAQRPPRLAVVARNPSINTEAEMLLVALSAQSEIELVERTELERIFQEQALDATQQRDYLKLGQLLKADGLLVLEPGGTVTEPHLFVQLIATGPAIILSSADTSLPLADLSDWAHHTARQFSRYWSKLVVTSREAVPVSLMNLRLAISQSADPELDRRLTAYLRQRLLSQPELFVLERSRMDQLVRENELAGLDGQKFWGGSYLLEGVLNPDGVATGQLMIQLRLTSPAKKTTEFSKTGSASRPEAIMDELAGTLVAELVKNGRQLEWKPRAEARQFIEEARWAQRNKLWPEALQAAEAAWALGARNAELTQLRLQSRIQVASRLPVFLWKDGDLRGDPPLSINEERLHHLLTVGAAISNQTNAPVFLSGNTNLPPVWLEVAGSFIQTSATTLAAYSKRDFSLQRPHFSQLASLREMSRSMIALLAPACGQMQERARAEFLKDSVFRNALFQENASAAADWMRQMVFSGLYRQALDLDRGQSPDKTLSLAVWNESPDGKEVLYKTYRRMFDELLTDERASVREDVLLGRMMSAVSAYELADCYREVWNQSWQNKDKNPDPEKLQNLWQKLGSELGRYVYEGNQQMIQRLRAERPGVEAQLSPWLREQERLRLQNAQREQFEQMKKKQAEFMAKIKEQQSQRKKYTKEEILAIIRNRPSQTATDAPIPVSAGSRLTLGKVTQSADLEFSKFWQLPTRFAGETNDVLTTILALDTYENDVLLDVSRPARNSLSRHWLRLNLETMALEAIIPPPALAGEMLPGYLELERRARDHKLIRLGDQLYRLSQKGMLRYSLSSKKWEEIPMALPVYCRLHVAGKWLLASNHEGLYLIDPVKRTFSILASMRRRPAESPIDNFSKVELRDCAPLGADHIVFDVNQKLYLLQVTQKKWRELVPPENYQGRLKSIEDTVLFETQDYYGLGGYMRMSGPDGKLKPFLEANVMGAPSVHAKLTDDGEANPRWFVVGKKKEQWQDFFSLDVLPHGNNLLVSLRPGALATETSKQSAQNVGSLFLCMPGLTEPIQITPQPVVLSAAVGKYGPSKGIGLHLTGQYLIAAPDNGSGLWLVPVPRIAQQAESGRVHLKAMTDLMLASPPVHPWLQKLRKEQKAY